MQGKQYITTNRDGCLVNIGTAPVQDELKGAIINFISNHDDEDQQFRTATHRVSQQLSSEYPIFNITSENTQITHVTKLSEFHSWIVSQVENSTKNVSKDELCELVRSAGIGTGFRIEFHDRENWRWIEGHPDVTTQSADPVATVMRSFLLPPSASDTQRTALGELLTKYHPSVPAEVGLTNLPWWSNGQRSDDLTSDMVVSLILLETPDPPSQSSS